MGAEGEERSGNNFPICTWKLFGAGLLTPPTPFRGPGRTAGLPTGRCWRPPVGEVARSGDLATTWFGIARKPGICSGPFPKPSSSLDSPGMGRFSPRPLELILDVHVGEVEVDRRRLETVVAQDLLHRRQADPLLQGRRGERVPQHMWAHVLGDPRAVGHRLDDVL